MRIKIKEKSESEARIINNVVSIAMKHGYLTINAWDTTGLINVKQDNIEYFTIIDD